MRFKIPEDALTRPLYRVGPVIIEADDAESIIDIAVTIACISIEQASTPRGLGVLAAFRAQTDGAPLLSQQNILDLRHEMMSRGVINIDYWHGRAVKLLLKEEDIGQRLSLSVMSWTDRWDVMADTTPPFVIDALREMLEAAAAEMRGDGTRRALTAGGEEPRC